MLILELLYLFSVALLAIYGVNTLLLTWIYWQHRDRVVSNRRSPSLFPRTKSPESKLSQIDRPSVTVQLPVYNERHVVRRLVDAVAALDWPAHRLHIQVLDDSTDDTTQLIETALARHQESGIRLEHIHRTDRSGFKAGALHQGLESSQSEFIAIFDADFVPPPDFLQRTIPMFADETIGCVQTRWGHVNPDTSNLTRSQALGIDGHFIVEQHARHSIGAFLNFNGTAGIWRRSSMEDGGGWQGDTLTEDLDLSYRVQLRGWQIAYLSDVVVPAELPVQVNAFKRQQFRWAKGSIQTAMKLLRTLWQAPEPRWRKVLGTLHLTNYAVHPLMLINLLFLLPMTFSESPILWIAPIFTTAAIGPPAMYWVALQKQSVPWPKRLYRLAILVALGTGLSVNNSRAVLEALTGVHSEFKRTPKFAITDQIDQWQTSIYALPRNPTVWIELLLGFYAFGVLSYSIGQGIWWVVPWLMLYAGGYSYISYLAFRQAWEMNMARRAITNIPQLANEENVSPSVFK